MLSEQLGDLEQCKVRKEKRLCSACSFSRLLKGTKRNETKQNETKRPFTKTGSGRISGKTPHKNVVCSPSHQAACVNDARCVYVNHGWGHASSWCVASSDLQRKRERKREKEREKEREKREKKRERKKERQLQPSLSYGFVAFCFEI